MKALGFLLLSRYIPHCGLFPGKTLRQQIQRTLSTDRAARKVMMREEEVCLGLSAGRTATSLFSNTEMKLCLYPLVLYVTLSFFSNVSMPERNLAKPGREHFSDDFLKLVCFTLFLFVLIKIHDIHSVGKWASR